MQTHTTPPSGTAAARTSGETAVGAAMPPTADLGALFALGLQCANAGDYVQAHKWLNIAAQRGLAEARTVRAEIAEDMTRGEIEEAQRQAREWLRLH